MKNQYRTGKPKLTPRPQESEISFCPQPVFSGRSAFEILIEVLNVLQTCRCRGSWANQYVTPEAKRTIDKILTNWIPSTVNLEKLTKRELRELGFLPEKFNTLMTVWRIPIWLENCIQNYSPGIQGPIEVILTTKYNSGERRTWEKLTTTQRLHTDRGEKALDHPHLRCGVVPGRVEEEDEKYDLKVTYGF